jgi:hypothetical protein
VELDLSASPTVERLGCLGERRHRSARTTTERRDYKIDGALFTPPQFTPISLQPAEWGLVNELLAARGATSKIHASLMPNAGPSPLISHRVSATILTGSGALGRLWQDFKWPRGGTRDSVSDRCEHC